MSTRSGKRLHGSVSEDESDSITELKCIRKTRKQQKENSEIIVTDKKRKNYVRYPSEEDIALSLNSNEELLHKGRKSRRVTLKECNQLITDSETSNDERKPVVRMTRRTKLFDANDVSENDPPKIEDVEFVQEKKTGKKKKTKKSSLENNITGAEPAMYALGASKKKSNKKKSKKRSNSVVVEDKCQKQNNSLNKSIASVDSFHSAASSPGKEGQNGLDSQANPSPFKENRKKGTFESEKYGDIVNRKSKRNKKKVENTKTSAEEKLLDLNVSQTEQDISEKSFENTKKSLVKFDNCEKTYRKLSIVSESNSNIDGDQVEINSEVSVVENTLNKTSSEKKRKSSIIDRANVSQTKLDTTYEKESPNENGENKSDNSTNLNLNASESRKKTSIKNSTHDKIENISAVNLDATYDKEQSNSSKQGIEMCSKKHSVAQISSLNSTYDKETNSATVSLDVTFDKNDKTNETFDNIGTKSISTLEENLCKKIKTFLFSSDNTDSKSDLTDDNSCISITSDESKENIINTTPVLIETSLDESDINSAQSLPKTKESPNANTLLKQGSDKTRTPLKREGTYTELKPTTPVRENTFTKNDKTPVKSQSSADVKTPTENVSDIKKTPTKKVNKVKGNAECVTPLKREGTFTKESPEVQKSRRQSLPSPGCTPFPMSKSALKEKSILNLTHSIEKRRSSLLDIAPRMTKVMFCSPVNNPSVVTQMKGKVIKSNLKGSNKSFVFDESVSDVAKPARKRSYTHSDIDEARAGNKRKRLTEDQQNSVQRLSRPRTVSASARLQHPGTPSKKTAIPTKPKPEKASRTKLPNFAALHQKQFEKMESLDECQERKAKRAQQLLTPTAPITVLERTSPKEQQQAEPPKKADTPKKQESGIPGYSRFGFKLNLDVNPFSYPKSTEVKPRNKLKALTRQATLPSLTGTTNIRKNIAKQTIMREKSFTDKRNVVRNENRTVIKGVRTNRRFELQMKMRNITEK